MLLFCVLFIIIYWIIFFIIVFVFLVDLLTVQIYKRELTSPIITNIIFQKTKKVELHLRTALQIKEFSLQ